MDYGVFSTLRLTRTPTCIAYDIVCQWFKKLWSLRVPKLPQAIQPKFLRQEDMSYIIGAMHIHGHTSTCQGPFAGEYREGNGRTFGDGIEHGWADLNQYAPSASRSGPGARADLLDDALGFWNKLKAENLGEYFLITARLRLC
jgi:hypothetical protein